MAGSAVITVESKAPVNRHESVSSRDGSEGDEKSLFASIKESRITVAYCLALTSGILLYGYDLVIVGNVSSMPYFQLEFGRRLNGKLIVPSLWLGLWNVANPIGGMFGSVFSGFVQDRQGRRFALALGSIISAVGVAIAYVSNIPGTINGRRGVFFLAKFVQGFAVNMAMCTIQTYMSEVLSRTLRGPILAFFPFFTLLGELVGSVVVKESLKIKGSRGYLNCFISQWPFCALPILVAALIPESPAYLVRKGRMEDALKAQQRLDIPEVDSKAKLEELQALIRMEEEQAKNHPATYQECFKGTNFRRTMIAFFAGLIPINFGSVLLAKGSYFVQMIGMNADDSIMMLEIGIGIGMAANLLGMWTLSRFGRVPLILMSFFFATFLWTGMGIAGCFEGIVTIWWTSATNMAVIFICGIGAWPAAYAVSSETSALRLRAKTQGLAWVVNCLGNGVIGLVLPYIFNPDEGNLLGKTAFVYTGFCLLTLVATWFVVPEMKNRSPIEIDQMFELRLPARKFKGWVREEEE